MQNAVIYARYSSSSQTEQSIDGQLRDCYEYAAREGYNVIGEYIDRALTGRTDNRPDFQRMISDAKKNQFQYVIVYKLDRFTRNRYDSAVYKHKLKQYGVKVVSATESISDNPEGIILEAVLEASAEYYSLELSQKIRRGCRESALKGQFVGGSVPIGYKLQDKRLVIDEEKAPIIKWVFEEYAKGVSKKEIIDALADKGIRAKSGKPYGSTAFQKALRCEKYIGVMRWADIVVEDGCPALIDKATFEKVQELLDKNRKAGATKKARTEYILYSKLFCGHCGTKMIGDSGTSKGGARHHYYSCQARKNCKACDKKAEKKDYLEWYVVEQTLEYVLTPTRMEIIAAAVVAEYDKEFNNSRVAEMEKRLSKVVRDIKKLFDMMLETNSKAIMQNCEQKIEELELQKTDLEIDIAKLNVANGIRYTKADILAWLKTFCKGDLFDTGFRKRIIDVFINSVYLYDDKVIIYYNIKEGRQVSYIEMLDSLDEKDENSGGAENENTLILTAGTCSDIKAPSSPVPPIRRTLSIIAVDRVFLSDL